MESIEEKILEPTKSLAQIHPEIYLIKESDTKHRDFLTDVISKLSEKIEGQLEKNESKVLQYFSQKLFDLYQETVQFETQKEIDEWILKQQDK